MTRDRRLPPQVKHWADVDPARWPFDRESVPAVVREVAPPRTLTGFAWNQAMSWPFVDHYGDWAYFWWHVPVGDYLNEYVDGYDAWEPIVRPEDEHLALVAELLVKRRELLEQTAEIYAAIAPTLVDAAGYEAAITRLLSGGGSEEDSWNWCGYWGDGVRWLLEAAGIPPDRVSAAIDDVFAEQQISQPKEKGPTPGDIAERIAARLCGPGDGPTRSGRADDDWPDTWPDQWPSWRATNRRRSFTDAPPGRGR